MKPIERIQIFMHFKKISPHAFEQKIDLSNGYFSKQLKNLGSVGSDILIKIYLAYPELDILWILTGEGQMLKLAEQESQQIDDIILEDFTKPLSLSFRLFGNVLADELTISVLTSLVPVSKIKYNRFL
jgi:hypothetical protein